MATIPRKSDGRRIFTAEFKREHMARVWRGEATIAELSRTLGIARSLLQRWKRLLPEAQGFAEPPRERATRDGNASASHYVRELQRLVGKQAIEIELLRAELGALRKNQRYHGGARR